MGLGNIKRASGAGEKTGGRSWKALLFVSVLSRRGKKSALRDLRCMLPRRRQRRPRI